MHGPRPAKLIQRNDYRPDKEIPYTDIIRYETNHGSGKRLVISLGIWPGIGLSTEPIAAERGLIPGLMQSLTTNKLPQRGWSCVHHVLIYKHLAFKFPILRNYFVLNKLFPVYKVQNYPFVMMVALFQ